MSKKLQEYLNLLNLPYEEAIERMSSKYGVVKDDYYRKKSYERFLKGENKTITGTCLSNFISKTSHLLMN